MDEEWGPWIYWNRKYAVPNGVQTGDFYHGVMYDGEIVKKTVDYNFPCCWRNVVKFRIKKPRGMNIIQEILREVEETTPVKTKKTEKAQ